MPANPRQVALAVLFDQAASHTPVDQVLEHHLSGTQGIDERDGALMHAIVIGVLRWQGYLDWLIKERSSRPLTKINPHALQVLRVALFQMIFLDRIPTGIAVHETIEAGKKSGKLPRWLVQFVNGLLRNLARSLPDLPDPFSEEALLRTHPAWLLSRWLTRYGRTQTLSILRANCTQPSLVLRVNTTKTTPAAQLALFNEAGIEARKGHFSQAAIHLPAYRGRVDALPGFFQGYFQVQDEAAQLASLLMAPFKEGGKYLDACSGVGGKTSHLVELAPKHAHFFAIEPHVQRAELQRKNLERLGAARRVTLANTTLYDPAVAGLGFFDAVLVDAPCSGLGVIRRQPDIRWNRENNDLKRYHEEQTALLRRAATLVGEEGILVYATCSTEPEENEKVVHQFLAGHENFAITDARDFLPGPAKGLIDSNGFFRALPAADPEIDGFFAARLKKLHTQ